MYGIDFSVCHNDSANEVIEVLRREFGFKVTQPYHGDIWIIRADFRDKRIYINNKFGDRFENEIVDGRDARQDRGVVIRSMQKFSPFGHRVFDHGFRSRHVEHPFARKQRCDQHLVDSLKYQTMHFDFNDFDKPRVKRKQEQNFKQMEVFKQQLVKVNGNKREVSIVVLTDGKKLKAVYSVRVPGDKKNEELARSIAKGRALKPKTNLIDMELGKGLDEKFIMYAIADNLFAKIERGHIEIRGIK